MPPAEALAPFPGRGRLYRYSQLVGPGDVDSGARAHLDAVVRWLQDAAQADIVDTGLTVRGAWLIRRLRIVVRRLPSFGERLAIETFCSGVGATVAERRTSIGGDAGADVEASATWVHVDSERHRPTPPGDEFLALYAASAAGRRPRSRLSHPPPPSGASASTWHFGIADTDLAGHVNHAAFWRMVEEHLGESLRADPLDLEAEHRAPAAPGEVAVLGFEDRLWVVDGRGGHLASFRARPHRA
jgi:acyl-ACP thioesterase